MGDANCVSGLDAVQSWRSGLDRGPREVWASAELGPFACSPGCITVLGAQPGLGKTSFSLAYVIGILRQYRDLKALIMNAEMPPGSLIDRAISNLAEVNAGALWSRTLARSDLQRVDNALERHKSVLARIYFSGPPFTVLHALHGVEQTGARLACLDYLQKLNMDVGSSAKQRVDIVCTEVRELCEMTGCAVLMISALARSKSMMGTSEYNTDAGMAGYKESGSIEYDGDFPWIMGPVSRNADGSMTLRMVAEKNRYGAKSDYYLRFDGALQRFHVCDPPKAKQRASSKGAARNVLGERDDE